MSVPVYKLLTRDTYDNAYALNRHESWYLVRDTCFPTEEEAVEYVRQQMQRNPDFVRLSVDLTSAADRAAFLDTFCHDLKYVKYHRHFVGLPNWDRLEASLQQDGVTVERRK